MINWLSSFAAIAITLACVPVRAQVLPDAESDVQSSVVSKRIPLRVADGIATATHLLSPRTRLGFVRVTWPDGHTVNSALSASWKLEVGDVDGDGVDELVLGTWSSRGPHDYLTRRTIWLLEATREGLKPKWRGSQMPVVFDDFELRRRHGRDFLVTHPTGPGIPSTIYRWTGFGFAVDQHTDRPPIRIAFVGDVAIARYEGQERIQVDPTPEALEATASADFVVANLETTVSPRPDGAAALRPTLQVTEDDLTLLPQWRIDAVTRANNHVMDAGDEGWDKTSKALDSLGIQDLTNSDIVLGNQRLSVTSATLHPARLPGPRLVVPDHDASFVAELVSHWKAQGPSQLKIVSLHGGVDGATRPTQRMESLTHRLLQKGADLVIWHGSHAPARAKATPNGIVAWGLGDFALKRKNRGCTLLLELNRHGDLTLAAGPNSCKE